jgi:hypothetical protein
MYISELSMTHRKITLPARVIRVRLRKTLSDGQAVPEGFQSLWQISLRN